MATEPYSNIGPSAGGVERALDAGQGIVRLAPTWVPRMYCTPGRRIRLHPDDYFPFEQTRSGAYEGLSLVIDPAGGLIPFDEFVAHHKADAIG